VNDGLRILIVDDDRPLAKTLADVLKLKGFRAEAAFSGPHALEMVGCDQFDCVLTDVKMPVVNGVELLRAIRAGRPHLPVVLMTAHAPGDLIHEGLREGAMATFVKPLDIDLLVWFLSELSGQCAILIVDDDAPSWRTAQQILERLGFAVKRFRGPGGLMEALRPDGQVLFLAARLNGHTGWELLKRIRKRHGTLPVVLTFDGQEQAPSEVRRARRLGADACLRKPFEMEELLEVLADVRRRHLAAFLRRRAGVLVHQNDSGDETVSRVGGDAISHADGISSGDHILCRCGL
jgi:DNA-binding response OmpR family regulator